MNVQKRFSVKEESANAISHGLGLFIFLVASIIILRASIQTENLWNIYSTAIFGLTLILLYFSSTMNHSLGAGKAKNFFHNFDQIAIYLLIAGTYTPLSLAVIRLEGGWLMFGIEWGFAITGVIVKVFIPNKFERGVNTFVIISYVIMGWLLLLFLKPLFNNLSEISMILIFVGGFLYTFGIIFFKSEKLKFNHLIWHLFVIAGSASHWMAIYMFIKNV